MFGNLKLHAAAAALCLSIFPTESVALNVGGGVSANAGANVGGVNADDSASVVGGTASASADVGTSGGTGTGTGTGGTTTGATGVNGAAVGAVAGTAPSNVIIGINVIGATVLSSENRMIGFVQSAEVQQDGEIIVRVALLEQLNAGKPYARILLRRLPPRNDIIRIGMNLDRFLKSI